MVAMITRARTVGGITSLRTDERGSRTDERGLRVSQSLRV